MKKVDRWLLPDGIEEMLPDAAARVEDLRRNLVDLFRAWGYDYVIPPMMEFTDSLLTGAGEDISLLTFKLTDQLSGKTLGLRADITPQVARMDAHSLKREGVNRLCYAGHVAHTLPKSALSSRTPVQAGVELFGEAGLEADVEVLSLLLDTLPACGLSEQYLDLGHVGIYRSLSEAAELDAEQEAALFELMQSKAYSEIDAWLAANVPVARARDWLSHLPKFSGSADILAEAAAFYADAPSQTQSALADLADVAATLAKRFPDAKLYFDLSELRGYHYLTGLVFGAFAPGMGTSIASGGRYDSVGEAFGRSRPATGFAVDVSAVCAAVAATQQSGAAGGVFAPYSDSDAQWDEVQALRRAGQRVVCGFQGQEQAYAYQRCDRILRESAAGFVVESSDQ